MLKNMNKIRARESFTFVKNNPNESDLMKKLPVMFQVNGLLAGFAFLLKGESHKKVATHLLEYLVGVHMLENIDASDPGNVFADWVGDGGLETIELFELTEEIIKYSTWLKRAAEALTEN